MQACVLHAVGDLRHEDVPTPMPQPGEVLLRVAACGVCGSDIPRIFTKGTYRFPLIPGHEFSGTVATVGQGVDPTLQGKRVAVFPLIPCQRCALCEIGAYAQCRDYDYLGSRRDGAFAEFVRVPAWNLVPVPDTLSLEEAALVEPAAVGLHALRRGQLDAADRVLIFGAGPIGLLCGLWARALGASRVLIADPNVARLRHAKSLGFEHLIDPAASDPVAWVEQKTPGGADLVIEAAGVAPAYAQALLCARPFGRVVLLGNPAGDMPLDQGAYWSILRKELTVVGAWNSVYSNLPKNEWRTVVEAMASGRLNVRPLITHRTALHGLHDHLARMRDGKEFTSKILVTPGEEA